MMKTEAVNARVLEAGKEHQKGQLYRFSSDRVIYFKERQKIDKTFDRVELHISLSDGQIGFFGEEFKPDLIVKEGAKKTDILALIADAEKKRVRSWIFDVKRTIGGEEYEETIRHLVEQLKATIKYKNMILLAMQEDEDDCMETEVIGFITRDYQIDYISEKVSHRKERLHKEREKRKKLPDYMGINPGALDEDIAEQKTLKFLEQFLSGKMVLKTREISLKCYIMAKQPDGNYLCEFEAACC